MSTSPTRNADKPGDGDAEMAKRLSDACSHQSGPCFCGEGALEFVKSELSRADSVPDAALLDRVAKEFERLMRLSSGDVGIGVQARIMANLALTELSRAGSAPFPADHEVTEIEDMLRTSLAQETHALVLHRPAREAILKEWDRLRELSRAGVGRVMEFIKSRDGWKYGGALDDIMAFLKSELSRAGGGRTCLSGEQRRLLVEAWRQRNLGALDHNRDWALNDLACEVIRAMLDMAGGKTLDIAHAQNPGDVTTANFDHVHEKSATVVGETKHAVIADIRENLARETAPLLEEIKNLRAELEAEVVNAREARRQLASVEAALSKAIEGRSSFWGQMCKVQFQGEGMIYRGTACAIARDADLVIASQAAELAELRALEMNHEGAIVRMNRELEELRKLMSRIHEHLGAECHDGIRDLCEHRELLEATANEDLDRRRGGQ